MLRLICAILVLSPATLSAAETDAEFFERKIRPILTEHCFRCHSDQGKEPKGGFRLDSRAAMLAGGDNGPAIVPGSPEKSRLIEAVKYTKVDFQMPPKAKLSDPIIAVLTEWVKRGAVWPNSDTATVIKKPDFNLEERRNRHWAWKAIQQPKVPATRNHSERIRNPIDSFIFAGLEASKLTPATEADKRTLLRRAYFALVGLPPKPEETEAFLKDQSPDAYEKLIDRLLASPSFGERWGRHWLDLVRYAESRGHEFDPTIPNAWQYRDYVIRAFNEDVPYTQFVKEHLAGELLAKPRLNPKDGFNESILGTGFWFLGEEVHSPVDIRQDQADRLDNRIDVMTKTFLGLTVSCARCHDHKFDAISTKDYYSLFALLEASSHRLVRFDSLEQNRNVAEELAAFRKKTSTELQRLLRQGAEPILQDAEKSLLALLELQKNPENPELLKTILGEKKLSPEHFKIVKTLVEKSTKDATSPFHLWNRLLFDPALKAMPIEQRLRQLTSKKSPATGEIILDYATPGRDPFLPDEAAFGTGPIRPGDIRSTGNAVRFAQYPAAEYDHHWDRIRKAAESQPEFGALGGDRAGRTIRTPVFSVKPGRVWVLLRGGCRVYAAVCGHTIIAGPLHGSIVQGIPANDQLRWHAIDLNRYQGLPVHLEFTANPRSDFSLLQVIQTETPPPVPTLGMNTFAGATTVQELAKFCADHATGSNESLQWLLTNTELHGRNTEAIKTLIATHIAGEKTIADKIRVESRLSSALYDGPPVAEQVFIRGSPKAPGEKVVSRLPAGVLKSPDVQQGRNRLQVAEELIDSPENPFFARVMVNRLWHHLFGRGIVASTDNFGELGETPTHPELLDWLATEFQHQNWSMKKMIRMMMLSSTWRMASTNAATISADPTNRYYSRMNLKRLEGEVIRDSLLQISGRLNDKMAGPSIPIFLTPFLDGRGRPSSGPLDGDGRRSIYLATRRNFLSPMLQAFDTPIPFSTVGRRSVSSVPAQALILLNDPLVHQLAELFAKRMVQSMGSSEDKIHRMYELCFSRKASPSELAACMEFLNSQSDSNQKPNTDSAAWKALAHTLFCMKELIFVE